MAELDHVNMAIQECTSAWGGVYDCGDGAAADLTAILWPSPFKQ